jgi:hypothetical protein
MEWLNIHKRDASSMQIGSDFDGVSDGLEANHLFWNNPFATLYGNPPVEAQGPNADVWAFLVGPNNNPAWTGHISLRGNIMVNNLIAPYMYPGNDPGQFLAYESPFMDTNSFSTFQDLIPQLSPASTAGDIIGTCPSPNTNGPFTNLFIDLYVLDPEGWTNGIAFLLPDLTDNATHTNGFPAGRQFLGTFVDNGPLDRDPAVGHFNFDAAGLGLASGTQVTIAANYSMDAPGTHNGRMHTSNFSNPITLRAPLKIIAVSRAGTNVAISWTGGTGPYSLRRKSPITGAWATVQTGLSGTSTSYTDSGTAAYYQVVGN